MPNPYALGLNWKARDRPWKYQFISNLDRLGSQKSILSVPRQYIEFEGKAKKSREKQPEN